MREEAHWIEIGIVSKPHGIRGELRVIPDVISADRLLACRCWALEKEGTFQVFTPEKLRVHQGRLIMRIAGMDDRNAAEALRGTTVCVAEGDLPEPDPEALELVDIDGFEVRTEAGKHVGYVMDLMDLPTQSCLVLDDHGKEVLIPWVDEFVRNVDLETGCILIKPIEGLLESDEN